MDLRNAPRLGAFDRPDGTPSIPAADGRAFPWAGRNDRGRSDKELHFGVSL